MRAVVLAYHDMGCAGLRALLRQGYEVVAVYTHADDPGEGGWFESVAELAASRGIPVFAPDDINHPIWIDAIRAAAPDVIFSFYYRRLVGRPILDIPPAGCFNLHGSLLPEYRGQAPVNWVLVNGERTTGVTLHHMTERPDAGDIVCQKAVHIARDETGKTLYRKLVDTAAVMLDEYLPKIMAGTAPRRRQDESRASYFGRRRPADGEIDWTQGARRIENLVRAVSRPYPGAFSWTAKEKLIVWEARADSMSAGNRRPGTIVCTDPLTIACGEGRLRIDYGQRDGGIYSRGAQLADDLNLVVGAHLGRRADRRTAARRKKRVLVLGINGFIGNALTERLLESRRYEVHGLDLNSQAIERFDSVNDFFFHEGDLSIHGEWIEYHIKKCDVILPLVAIATPIEYTRNPLAVFELDFEENLRVIRHCVKYGKRVVFPSTSEVYGMCEDDEFDEDRSNLVLGPIQSQRWIYSSCKQLLDRVIWAYGDKHELNFTLFRPFNWIGPRLDSLNSARVGSSRAITQLILNLVEGTPIQLIDGGEQKRCFTDVKEGIECLYRIIENRGDACNGKIINIGNPRNEASIRELAQILVEEFDQHPLRERFPPFAGMMQLESSRYYGKGYQDVQHRVPSIRNARQLLRWNPTIGLRESVAETLDYFLRDYVDEEMWERRTPARRHLAVLN